MTTRTCTTAVAAPQVRLPTGCRTPGYALCWLRPHALQIEPDVSAWAFAGWNDSWCGGPERGRLEGAARGLCFVAAQGRRGDQLRCALCSSGFLALLDDCIALLNACITLLNACITLLNDCIALLSHTLAQ